MEEEELKDSDFELSASLADRKPLPESKLRPTPIAIQEVQETEEDHYSKFNNPGTGMEEFYRQQKPT